MSHWITFGKGKPKKFISRTAKIDPQALIIGFVFIGNNSNIGKSKIISEGNHSMTISKDTRIKSNVLITAKEDIFIGNKVFISGGVYIEGPTVIKDGTFIGQDSKITNSTIGQNCLIENDVVIKNVTIPPNTTIPSGSVIDSQDKIEKTVSRYIRYCALF